MPEVVATWAANAVASALAPIGVSGGFSVVNVAYAAAYAATAVALTAAAGAMSPTPDIETAKGSLKQAIPPRIRAYGRCRIGGFYMLWVAKENYAYDVVALHHGRIEAIEQVWSHDKVLTIAETGWVQGSPEYGGGNNDLIHIEWRLGAATETAYSAIVAALGSTGVWTDDHRGDGIASLGIDYHHGKKENLLSDYPSNVPKWAATGRWTPVWDPRVAGQERLNPLKAGYVHTASTNTAQQILDFLCHPDGMGMDYETEIAPALDHWKGEMDICDEAIPLAAGGTEPRYSSSLFYYLPGDRQETLNRLLAACDGRLMRDAEGVTRLWVGKVRTPTVWLTDEDIADYDVDGDADAFDVVNEIVPSYVSEAAGWSMIEASPWRNEADIAERGEVLSLPMAQDAVTSHGQVRRLAKRESRRQLTELRGTLIGRLSCVRALGERWIGVDLPDLGLENMVIEMERGGRTSFASRTVTLPFIKADLTVDDWDAETEEGGAGDPVPPPSPEALTAPTITLAEAFSAVIAAGVSGVRLHIEGSGPDRSDLTWFVRWRVSGSTSWSIGEVTDEAAGTAFAGDSGFVTADATVEVGLGYQTGGGTTIWSTTDTVDTTPVYTVPPPSELTATGGVGEATVGWYDPDLTVAYTRLRWSTGTDPNTATLGDPELQLGFHALRSVDVPLIPGTWRFWIAAYDAADVPSALIGPVAVVVT